MKAICVKDVSSLTKGKEYEVIDAGDGTYWLINDNGNLWCSYAGFFRLAPGPVPEPVNEWMQAADDLFINLKTGMCMWFKSDGSLMLYNISAQLNVVKIQHQYAEAFAQMVGYKWEE